MKNVTKTHRDIDLRIRRMVELCIVKIEANPNLLATVRDNVSRIADPKIRTEWERYLQLPWSELRSMLDNQDDAGDKLRQNVPFGGLLSEAERREFFR